MIGRTAKLHTLTAGVFIMLPAAASLASSDGESPGLFTGDIGNIIWTLITFLAVVFVLGKFVWKPVLNGLKAREDFISKSIQDADEANRMAQKLLAQHNEQLDKARAEASAIVDEGRRDAEVVRKELHEQAKQEADAMLQRAKREIGIARDTAVRELYDIGAKLATDVAGKIISKELNPTDHHRLIQESIDDMSKTNAGNN